MTTAYTSLLGLALPVTGELSGTWGDTVNNSITSLLDSAIAGTTTLSSDADVTLSNNDGTADTSRQAILLCTGARTAIRTITAPALSKIYTVINSTTGSPSAFSVQIVAAGPTTGVTIIAGEAAMIAWNGSDFVKVSNTGGSFTTQDLTVTGNTILGNAITDTTTLNAQTRFQSRAILGYANMTGPATTSLSTTAPAFLYSGATTYTVSDVSGGTQTHAPIISLGQATITNASTNTIYTNAPTLYIGGAPSAAGLVTFQRPYALYLDSGTTASATGVTYTNAATLYIAGAPTAGANVTLTTPYALYVNAGASYLGGNLGLGVAPVSGIKMTVYQDSTYAMQLMNASQNYALRVDATISNALILSDRTGFVDLLTVTSGGNLGVGTTAPLGLLNIKGSNGQLVLNNGASSGGMRLSAFTNAGTANGYLAFEGYSSEYGRFDASGRLLVGTTSNFGGAGQFAIDQAGGGTPIVNLIGTQGVGGGGRSVSLVFTGVSNDTGPTYTSFARISAAKENGTQGNVAGYLDFATTPAGGSLTSRMVIDSSGNLGIGTTNPNQALSVCGSISLGVGSTAGSLTMKNADSSSSATDARLLIGNSSSTYGALRMLFNSTADVAIDTVTWGNTSTQTNLLLNVNGGKIGMGVGSINASGGVLQLSSGITFPATQSASSNANTLDDYEEGTWTPSFTLGAGSATLNSASGSYVKIGKQVTVLFNISFATATAATIDTITGFTFPFANNTQYGVGALRENSNTGFMWQLRGNGNTTTAIIRKYDNTGVLTAGDTFVGTLTYFTD